MALRPSLKKPAFKAGVKASPKLSKVSNKAPVKRRRSQLALDAAKLGLPALMRDSWFYMIGEIAPLLFNSHVRDIQDSVQELWDKNNLGTVPPSVGQPLANFDAYAERVAKTVQGLLRDIANNRLTAIVRMIKNDNDVFRFELPSHYSISLDRATLPGYTDRLSFAEQAEQYVKFLREAVGLDFDKPLVLDKTTISRRKLDTGVKNEYYADSIMASEAEMLFLDFNKKSKEAIDSGVIKTTVDFEATINESSLTFTPKIIVEIESVLYDQVVDGVDNKREPLYMFMYMQQVLSNAQFGERYVNRWKSPKIVDLRIVSSQLRKVKQEFGSAKPRVNKSGFCIGGFGIPLFVPELDFGAQYVQDIIANLEIDDNGVYSFNSTMMGWANKVILVDWFNDYILYTSTSGSIQFERLLGVRAMDAATERSFLETPWVSSGMLRETIKHAIKIVSENVTSDEISALLPRNNEFGEFAHGELNIIDAFNRIATCSVSRLNNQSKYSAVAIKHLIGLDLREIFDSNRMLPPAQQRIVRAALVVSAALRALYSKRGKLDTYVMYRIQGLEYLMYAANTFADKHGDFSAWAALKTEVDEINNKRNSNYEFGDSIEVPNLTISEKNIKAIQPHQVNYLSQMKDGVDAGTGWIATGGGKGVVSVLEILMALQSGKVNRPLICTKPGLVKENISEINRMSNGKVNAVPLRGSILRHLKSKAGLRTAKDFLRWAKGLPKNTIFVCSYNDLSMRAKIFEDLDVPGRALWFDTHLSQMTHLLRLIGIDFVFGDESQQIKNLKSQRSICSYSAFSAIGTTRIASGTDVSNTPIDLVGQYYALNPIIFGGSVEAFADKYDIRGGLIDGDVAASRVEYRRSELSRTFRATEEDWSFVLPAFLDEVEYFQLTGKQEAFYNTMMQKAEIELKAELEDKKKKKKTNEDEDDDSSEEDDEEEYFIAKASVSLQRVEIFLGAPDKNKEYTTQRDIPTGSDLISPMVAKVDAYIDKHFAGIKPEMRNKEKVIVMAVNIAVVEHFAEHSKWARSAEVYYAGDGEALRKFKTDDEKLVLIAAETSIREGENLQMASLICRLQPVWAPGDYKQAAARAYRPDPRGIYGARENVRHTWFIANGGQGRPTLSSVKLARMISKHVHNSRLNYANDPDWIQNSDSLTGNLTQLRMNLDTIFKTNNEDIKPYYHAWSRFTKWVAKRTDNKRISIARDLEAKHNIDLLDDRDRIIDVKQFLSLIMKPLTSNTTLPGSKMVYTPWQPNAIPADHLNVGLELLGGKTAAVGSPVMTEFGAGKLITNEADAATVKVELYGDKYVTLNRLSVAIPSNSAGKSTLAAILKDKKAWRGTYMSPAHNPSDSGQAIKDRVKIAATKGAQSVDREENPLEERRATGRTSVRPTVNKNEMAEVFTWMLNGYPFLGVSMDEGSPALVKQGWEKLDSFYGVTFGSWAQADKFLDVLADKFYITSSKFNALVEEMETIKSGKSMILAQRIKETQVRQFLLQQHRMKGNKDGHYVIDPYWMAFDDRVYLIFDKRTHATNVFSWIKKAAAKVSLMKLTKPNEGFYVYGFKTLKEAKEAIVDAGKVLNFDAEHLDEELRELVADVNKLATRKNSPARR